MVQCFFPDGGLVDERCSDDGYFYFVVPRTRQQGPCSLRLLVYIYIYIYKVAAVLVLGRCCEQ